MRQTGDGQRPMRTAGQASSRESYAAEPP